MAVSCFLDLSNCCFSCAFNIWLFSFLLYDCSCCALYKGTMSKRRKAFTLWIYFNSCENGGGLWRVWDFWLHLEPQESSQYNKLALASRNVHSLWRPVCPFVDACTCTTGLIPMQLWVFPEIASLIPPLPSDALTHLRDYPSKHSPLGWGVVLRA